MNENSNPPGNRPGSPASECGATALVLSVVVAELREGLRAHAIRAGEVACRTVRPGVSVIDVSGMSVGDAAVLAVALNESAPGAGPSADG